MMEVVSDVSQWQRCPFCGAALSEPLGTLGREGPRCPDCWRIANAPDHPYYGVTDAVEYDFDDVTPAERAEAAELLMGAGIAYRWDEGYRLFVGSDDEDQVDALFDQPTSAEGPSEQGGEPQATGLASELGSAADSRASVPATGSAGSDEAAGSDEDEPAEWVADEESAQALVTLFDAADRLRHRPRDEDAAADLADAAGVVLVAALPFGVNRVLWATAGMLARQLVDLLEAGADEDDVAAGADALRAVLRDRI
jgi:hypothetical protein